jgi:uncharacterized protein (DUF2147 family)
MKLEVLTFVSIILSLVVIGYLVYRLKNFSLDKNLTGIWFNDALNVRILLHDIDSVFHGSVVWANGMDQLLGARLIDNLRFINRKSANGDYADPLTGKHYRIKINLMRKGQLILQAYHSDSGHFAFEQKWRLVNF